MGTVLNYALGLFLLLVAWVHLREPTFGATDRLAHFLMFAIPFCLALFLFGNRLDSTDNGSKRSGLRLYTDHATGVQYVGTAFGGLQVRVDLDGKPFTDKGDER